MRRLLALALPLLALSVLPACKGSTDKPATSPKGGGGPTTSCGAVATHVVAYGELLEETGANSKARVASYAGLLELLISFERASTDLEGQLASLKIQDRALADDIKKSLDELKKAAEFSKGERAAIEKHARDVAPLAKETQEAWGALRSSCEGKRGGADCIGVRDALAKFDAAETENHHDRVIADLAALRIPNPALARQRDRAVAASRAVQSAIQARAHAAQNMPKKWAEVQKGVGQSIEGIARHCKETAVPAAEFVAADRPDPRKLTVLLKVKPPAGVERSLVELARSASDEDERAFYEARAKGAFGSGFIVVRAKPGGGNETLIITNRHVVELGDKAVLELADGTSLGTADILYTDSIHDVAVLRPSMKLPLEQGFAFSQTPAKDQQPVIATGFPGMVGRPSYQTTRGYVSNESFRIDESGAKETLVQHTAPIDPGSSGGPLTDENGHVLGVNTLKVTNREAVGLAVPSSSILETIRRADTVEARRAEGAQRRDAARLACLGFVGELAATQPRMLVLEPMISNHLTSAEGMQDAAALGGDETFERVWLADSVRAMRIATLMRVRAGFMAGGGVSVLETCDQPNGDDTKADIVKFKVRLANFEMRDMALKWEQGHFKIAGFEGSPRIVDVAPATPPTKPGRPKVPPPKKQPPPRPKK